MSDRFPAVLSSLARPFAVVAIGAGVLLFVIPLATRSLTMADEGYLLLQSLDLANGKLLYREMDAFVTPGMWFLLAALFKLTAPSVIVSRIPVVVAYLLLIALSYRIPARFGGVLAGLCSVLIMLICSVWAFPAWTFAFYSPFSVLFALAGLDRLLTFRSSSKRRDLILTGLLLGLSILFKQNYGVFALVGAWLALGALRFGSGESKLASARAAMLDSCWLAAGVAAIALPTLVYFGVEGSLAAAYHSLILHPLEFGRRQNIPYLGLAALFSPDFMSDTAEIMTYGAQPIYRTPLLGGFIASLHLVERLHVLLYWFPPLILIMGCTLALQGSGDSEASRAYPGPESFAGTSTIHGGLLSVLLVCFGLFLGVFPRADFNHLINVYQPVVIAGVSSFAVFFDRRRERPILLRKIVAVAMTALLSAYFGISAYWYYALIKTMNIEVGGSRGGVMVSPPEASSLNQVLRNLAHFGRPGDALLTVPDIAMLNFLSKRPMPSAYYNLYEHHIAHDGGAGVAAGAEQNHATVAITRLDNFFSDRVGLRDYAPVLVDYIDTHFEQKYTIGRSEYLFYTRRAEPMAPEIAASVLEDCGQSSPNATIEEHLLFRTLYQTIGRRMQAGSPAPVTRCRVEIPRSGGELVWQMDYSHPAILRRSTTLWADVFVEANQKRRRVFSKVYSVTTLSPRVSRFAAPPEYRVDLSDYAGQTVDLILQTAANGRVVMSGAARHGFGINWQHPRIVARRPAHAITFVDP